MAGDWHEAITKLILDNSDLAWELYEVGRERIRPVCTDAWHGAESGGTAGMRGVRVGSGTRAESVGKPIFHKRRADRIVAFEFRDGSRTMVICEVQSVWKDEKALRLPGYVARTHEDHGLPAELVMVCKTDGLAERYRKGLWLGEHSVISPAAVGPGDLIPITDPESAGQSPQMSVVTALLQEPEQGHDEQEKTLVALRDRLGAVSDEQASDYAYYLCKIKGEEFMALMDEVGTEEAEPEWWRRAKARMLGEGREDAVQEGRAKGLDEGRAEGLARQRATLLSLMNELSVSAGMKDLSRIERCTDPDQIAEWTMRVVRSKSAAELFGDS